MLKTYKKKLFISVGILSLLCILTILFSQLKPPLLDKKNFFTISGKSPEYLLNPIKIQELTSTQNVNYPHVNISSNRPEYPIVNIIQFWNLNKKGADNLFYASKHIAEILQFSSDVSWASIMNSYKSLVFKQLVQDANIEDPRVKLKRYLYINSQVNSHKNDLYKILSKSNKIKDEKVVLMRIIERTFSEIQTEINRYLPPIRINYFTYPLFDPLIDRENGVYEAQFIIDNNASDDIKHINVSGKDNYLFIPSKTRLKKLKIDWQRIKDANNTPVYSAQIEKPFEKETLVEIGYHLDREAKIIIKNVDKEMGTDSSDGDEIFYEIVYPKEKPDVLFKTLTNHTNDKETTKFEIWVELLNQPQESYNSSVPKINLTLHEIIDPPPDILLTKKSYGSESIPKIKIKKINLFQYQLAVEEEDFFNNRQIRYNLSFGWAADNSTKIMTFFPGVFTIKLLYIFSLLSIFYGICLITKKPLDKILFLFIKQKISPLDRIKKSIIRVLKRILIFSRPFSLLLGVIFLLIETFAHNQSSDVLILITILLWMIATVGYSLGSRYSFILSMAFFLTSACFLIIKPNNNVNFNSEAISKNEIIANKFAVWTILFLILGIISTLLETKFSFKKSLKFKPTIVQLFHNLKMIHATALDYLRRYPNVIQNVRTIKDFFIPKKITIKYILKIMLITVSLTIGGMAYLNFNNYEQARKRKILIISVSPKKAIQASPVLLKGYNLGIKSDDTYKVMSNTGPIQDIQEWHNDKVIFSVPLSFAPGNYSIWVERQKDESFKDEGMIKSNKVTIEVYSRFFIYPENNSVEEKIIKKVKRFIFYNIPILRDFIFL